MVIAAIDDGPIALEDVERSDLAELNRLVRQHRAHELKLVGPSGQQVELPDAVLRVLRQAGEALARDQVVTVHGMSKELTLDQVGELLDLPRGDLARLLDQGVMPSRTKNGRRRVRFEDVMRLKRQRDAERQAILRRMTQEGQEIEDLQG